MTGWRGNKAHVRHAVFFLGNKDRSGWNDATGQNPACFTFVQRNAAHVSRAIRARDKLPPVCPLFGKSITVNRALVEWRIVFAGDDLFSQDASGTLG